MSPVMLTRTWGSRPCKGKDLDPKAKDLGPKAKDYRSLGIVALIKLANDRTRNF